MSAAGALISTATFGTSPSWRALAGFTIASTPAMPSSAWAPNGILARTAATGYSRPLTRCSFRAAGAVVIRSPAAKADHTARLAAVSGGVHGRSALAGALSTVSGLPLTVIRAPAMGSTALTWLSFLILARSAWVAPPGTAAMTSGTTSRGAAAPIRFTGSAAPSAPGAPIAFVAPTRGGSGRDAASADARIGSAGWLVRCAGADPPASTPTQLATATATASSPPPMTACLDPRRRVRCLTIINFTCRTRVGRNGIWQYAQELTRLRLRSDYDAGGRPEYRPIGRRRGPWDRAAAGGDYRYWPASRCRAGIRDWAEARGWTPRAQTAEAAVARRRRARPRPRAARAGSRDRAQAARGRHDRVRGAGLQRCPRRRRGPPGRHLARHVLPVLLQQGGPVPGAAAGRAARHGDRGRGLPRRHQRRDRPHSAPPVGTEVLRRLRSA